MDNYGNYFCQKLLQACSPSQRIYIIKRIEENIYLLCKDKRATHVIQTIVELNLTEEEQSMVYNKIKGHVAELANVYNI